MYVVPAYRRRGIADLLMKMADNIVIRVRPEAAEL
ncbi:GNAT family N-acetyltransferase [Herbaspirillum lusitanum]